MPAIVCLDDFRALARRRLPRLAFDFIDGAAGTEAAAARNAAAFRNRTIRPRVLRGCVDRSAATTLFGRSYQAPFGIAPIGLGNLAWPGTDLALARTSSARGIPMMLSTAATTRIEDAAVAAEGNLWFQLYVGQDHAIVLDLVDRAARADIDTLVVTLDVPSPGKRRRDLRNRFALPLRPGPRMAIDLALHPAWALATARSGPPRFANLEPYHQGKASAGSLAQFMAAQSSARLARAILEELRKRWRGALVVKGLLHPDDARMVRDMGADGVIVSNHGGRQFDGAIAPLDALPAIRAALGDDMPVMMDGGVRSGEDILIAIASGADFVFLGRPFLFAVAARGRAGADQAVSLLIDEIDRGLAQIGFSSIAELRANREALMVGSGAA